MKENPKIEWVGKFDKSCLKFTFVGMLVEQDAIIAIEKWKEAFQSKRGEEIVVVWQCLKMKGYDTESRVLWQEALKEMKSQIASIWLVTNSNFIKIGANVMSVFTSLNIRIVSSESEIEVCG